MLFSTLKKSTPSRQALSMTLLCSLTPAVVAEEGSVLLLTTVVVAALLSPGLADWAAATGATGTAGVAEVIAVAVDEL